MTSIATSTICIGRDSAEIWSFLTDFHQLARWLGSDREARQLDEGSLGRGSVLQVDSRKGPLALTVSYWEPHKRLSLFQRTRRFQLETSLQLTPIPGGTEVDVSLRLQGRGLWRPVAPLMARLRSRATRAWLLDARRDLEGSKPGSEEQRPSV
jgi:uncharacterized protein YndB with AHSA1/START domain